MTILETDLQVKAVNWKFMAAKGQPHPTEKTRFSHDGGDPKMLNLYNVKEQRTNPSLH